MTSLPGESPAGKVMDEAIELAIEGRSPFPECSLFIDEDSPSLGKSIKRAAAEGRAIVLVSADGATEVLTPRTPPPAPQKGRPGGRPFGIKSRVRAT